MSIYEKSTNQLLTEWIEQNLKPGQTVDKSQIVSWFKDHYPKIKSNTVNCHIIKFSTNHRTRVYYNASTQHDKLFQLPNKKLRMFDPDNDPTPIYASGGVIDAVPDDTEEVDSSAFAYESHLRDYLKDNLHKIEQGLRLYTDEEDPSITGVEFDAGGKRIDILALDSHGDYVIIELKVSKGHEKVIGQLLRYKAWIRKNLAEDQKVRGIIIAKDISEDLLLAASEAFDIDIYTYDLKVDLRKIDA